MAGHENLSERENAGTDPHPIDEDLSMGTPDPYPIDEDLSMGTPDPRLTL
jgi:hypothetical protein